MTRHEHIELAAQHIYAAIKDYHTQTTGAQRIRNYRMLCEIYNRIAQVQKHERPPR